MKRTIQWATLIGGCLTTALVLPNAACAYGGGLPPGAGRPQSLRDPHAGGVAQPATWPSPAGAYDHPAYSGRIQPAFFVGPQRGHWHAAGPYYAEGYQRPRPAGVWNSYRDPRGRRYAERRRGPIRPWHR